MSCTPRVSPPRCPARIGGTAWLSAPMPSRVAQRDETARNHTRPHGASTLAAEPTRSAANDLPVAILERAADKARSGAAHAAANILTCLPPVRPHHRSSTRLLPVCSEAPVAHVKKRTDCRRRLRPCDRVPCRRRSGCARCGPCRSEKVAAARRPVSGDAVTERVCTRGPLPPVPSCP